MKTVVRLALVDPNDATRTALKSLMLGIDTVWLEAECSRYDFFFDVVVQTRPDIALVALDSDSAKGLALVAKIAQELPECNVLVISSSTEGSLILQAMRNGAKEFLGLPLRLEDVLSALERMRQTQLSRTGEGQVRACQVIAVAGSSGGAGCTSLAVNLGCILARNEQNSVVVIDLDFALGDSDVWLDIIPDYTIQDVAENITRLDYSLLKRSLTRHDCGLFLLPRPVQLDDNLKITADQLRRVIALLKTTFTHLVVDTSKSFGPLDMAALETAQSVLLVTQLDLPSLRNVVRLMQYFEHVEGLTEKIHIVVNRVGLEDTQISLNKALETIGREISWQVPNDFATMVEARNNGVPLLMQAPRAKLTRALEQLAQQLDHHESLKPEAEEKKGRRGLFGFLGSGAK
ncbi:MAG TPA: AAA family ATPase [Planctomycetaceae bacterium]|nr:AAA family ATPase [Planctomycetaceae bacterium]